MSGHPFRIGTRKSTLALRQTGLVCDLLRSARPDLDVEVVTYESSGDKMLGIPAPQLALDAFTDSIETALAAGEIEAAVHSYKDLPPDDTPGLIVAAVPLRADPREALVCARPLKLNHGIT